MTSVVFFLKTHNLSIIMRKKKSNKSQWRDSLKLPVLLKTLRVIKTNEKRSQPRGA